VKKDSYVSTKESKRDAQRVLAFLEGSGKGPKDLTTSLVFAPKDIRHIRTEVLGLSQSGFARLLKKEPITVASWEAGRRIPDATTTMLIYLLSKHRQLKGWMEDVSTPKAAKVAA
jgi:DNA-binding transcriptional regulator YiaG